MPEHFLYSAETTYGTWVTPTKALHVISAEFGSEREVMDIRTTGSNRGLLQRVLGAKPVVGTVQVPWRTAGIGTILKQFMRDYASSAGDNFRYGFAFKDTDPILGLSIQNVFRTDSAGVSLTAQNILSALVDTWTITGANKEAVQLEFAMQAKDEALAAGTNKWEYNGGASPGFVANPSTLYPALYRPYVFYDGQIIIGGTPAWNNTTKIITVTGGTAYAKVSTVTITVNNGLDAEGYGITQDPTRQEIWPGNREITVTFELSWTDYAETLYNSARNGTPMAFHLSLVGPEDIPSGELNLANVIVPSLFLDPNKLPPISGDQGRRMLSLTGKAQYDTVTGKDFNVWIDTPEATI